MLSVLPSFKNLIAMQHFAFTCCPSNDIQAQHNNFLLLHLGGNSCVAIVILQLAFSICYSIVPAPIFFTHNVMRGTTLIFVA